MIVGALMDMTAEIAYQPMSARVSAEAACEIWHKVVSAEPWYPGFILRVTVRTAGRWWPYPKCVPFRDRRHEMSKLRWLLAALGMTLIGLVPVLVSSSSASADPGAIL